MIGAYLPGNSTAELREVPDPRAGHGEVLLRMKASTICGSDIRCIYHEHLGKGPEGYQRVIAGHEPCGQIVEDGRGLPPVRRRRPGHRLSHLRLRRVQRLPAGYMISCSSAKYRRAYGWQRDGGMADYLVAEEKDLIALPAELSYGDGAQVACGFGTVYEGLQKIGICGDHDVLVTGLGPVGIATAALCRKLGAQRIIGIDVVPERLELTRELSLCDSVLTAGPCQRQRRARSHQRPGRRTCCRLLRQRRCACDRDPRHAQVGAHRVPGEGGRVEFDPSPDIIHDQKTIYGSWVTSTWLMEEFVERLVRWNLHPADLITHRFALAEVGRHTS